MPTFLIFLVMVAILLAGIFGSMFSDADVYETNDRDVP